LFLLAANVAVVQVQGLQPPLAQSHPLLLPEHAGASTMQCKPGQQLQFKARYRGTISCDF
jgi:hypothetical protein